LSALDIDSSMADQFHFLHLLVLKRQSIQSQANQNLHFYVRFKDLIIKLLQYVK